MKFDINKLIAWVLHIGVYLSMSLFILGIIVSLFHPLATQSHFGLTLIARGLILLNPKSFFYTGIIILMLTPVVRVLFLFIGYLIERDYIFSLISAFVFLILLLCVYFGFH